MVYKRANDWNFWKAIDDRLGLLFWNEHVELPKTKKGGRRME